MFPASHLTGLGYEADVAVRAVVHVPRAEAAFRLVSAHASGALSMLLRMLPGHAAVRTAPSPAPPPAPGWPDVGATVSMLLRMLPG